MRSWIFLFLSLLGAAKAVAEPKVGQLASIFVMTTLEGRDFNLSLLRGKVVLVNYWATWCPPCMREQKLLNKTFTRFHGQGLEMIGVSQDASGDRAKVVKMKAKIPYAVAMAEDARVNDFGEQDTIPTSFLVDRQGILRRIFTNDKAELSETDLSKAVQGPLAEAAKTASP